MASSQDASERANGAEQAERGKQLGQLDLNGGLANVNLPHLINLIEHVQQTGSDLVDQSTVGFFIGLMRGDLTLRGHARIPLKRLIVFAASLLVLGLIFWVTIHPWPSHIEIIIK